ncbi:DUF1819 domain-containing protein [Sphingobacteriales bacterium UPWRP_1]|nr:hypothetical protein BVG80_10200 [Sphingobacteriales bacterium TSM_CSM]PSJ73787.1 DUF1819 domain-containing protein [Sphingobacteriales bacterium UPWRP_1]
MLRYTASFTSGALVWHETLAILPLLLKNDMQALKQEIETGQRLQLNARKSRQSIVKEITKRFKAVPIQIWEYFIDAPKEEQVLILYYAALKTYQLILDFHLEVLLKKWTSFNLFWDKTDVATFLLRQSNKHPEIDKWTLKTHEKIASVIFVMLKEAGLVKDGKLHEPMLPDKFWTFFCQLGEAWLLEAFFLHANKRQQITHYA